MTHPTTTRRHLLQTTGGAAAIALLMIGQGRAAAPQRTSNADTGGGTGSDGGPVRITFLFGLPDDIAAFEDHYVSTHLPLVRGVPRLEKVECCASMGNLDGHPGTFYRATTLTFAGPQAMQEAARSDEGRRALADLDAFATGGVTATLVHAIADYTPAHHTQNRFRNGVDPRQP